MKRTRNFYVGVTIMAVIAVLAIAQYTLQTVARAQENGSANRAGIYEVDRMWPKPTEAPEDVVKLWRAALDNATESELMQAISAHEDERSARN